MWYKACAQHAQHRRDEHRRWHTRPCLMQRPPTNHLNDVACDTCQRGHAASTATGGQQRAQHPNDVREISLVAKQKVALCKQWVGAER